MSIIGIILIIIVVGVLLYLVNSVIRRSRWCCKSS